MFLVVFHQEPRGYLTTISTLLLWASPKLSWAVAGDLLLKAVVGEGHEGVDICIWQSVLDTSVSYEALEEGRPFFIALARDPYLFIWMNYSNCKCWLSGAGKDNKSKSITQLTQVPREDGRWQSEHKSYLCSLSRSVEMMEKEFSKGLNS